MPRARLLAALPLAALIAVAGCTTQSGTKVAVTGTDSACTPASTQLGAGRTTFVFENRAKDVNELYVLRPDKSVVGEVENVTTGTKRNLTVTLSAGTYVLTCKPGQKGDGFSTPVTVTGTGGGAAPAPGRTVDVGAADFAFTLPPGLTIKKGETVRLQLTNQGSVDHELEVLAPSGDSLGEVAPVKPGATGTATLTFRDAGTYTFVCGIQDHAQRGMKATIAVK